MSITESVFVAMFCMGVVFAVLLALWGAIRVFSAVLLAVEKKISKPDVSK